MPELLTKVSFVLGSMEEFDFLSFLFYFILWSLSREMFNLSLCLCLSLLLIEWSW